MKKRKIVLLAGAAVVLAGTLAASFILTGGRHRGENKTQPGITQREEETGHEDNRNAEERKKDKDKGVLAVYGIGHLYYLAPEDEQTFKEKLTAFVKKTGRKASSAAVLEDHEDDRDKEDEPAEFYLLLDDKDSTVIRVSFDKPTGHYIFAMTGIEADPVKSRAGDKDEAGREYEIPESSADEETKERPVSITDTEKELTGAADMESLEEELTAFLYSIDEGRRNFYVSSFRKTEEGYEAVLDFETVRHDGRNVEVKFDGTWHFRLI